MAFSPDGRDSVTPDTVDLRESLWPVEDLGDILGAASSAAVTALEYHCNRMGLEPIELSSTFVHYNARRLNGDVATNRGTSIEDAMKAIATYGACRETTWPFDRTSLTQEPSPEAYAEAKRFAGIQYFVVDDLFESLALRYPIPFFGRIPRRCLDEASRTGLVPDPTQEERRQSDVQPGHGMVLVAYNRIERMFTARNCWGEQWGDRGHCRISFEAMSVFAPIGAGRFWIIAAPGAGEVVQPAAVSGGVASGAARMREEIRKDLERDMAASSKRIGDLLSRKGGAIEQPGVHENAPAPRSDLATCYSCQGSGRCWWCKGAGGCSNCFSGSCPTCRGRGAV